MGTLTKGPVGEQDLKRWDGTGDKTFARETSSGGRVVLNKIGHEVDALISYGQGTHYTAACINAAIASIGSVVTRLVLRPGTWDVNANVTFPSNITVVIPAGCVLDADAGITVTFNGPIEADAHDWQSGSGTFTIGSPTNLNIQNAHVQLKGDARMVRFKDTGASGKEWAIRSDGGKFEICENTATEASPTWTVRYTVSTSSDVFVDALLVYGGGTDYTLATLQAAITGIGSSDTTHLVLRPGTWTITDDLTVPANIILDPVPGSILSISTTKTLTINGPFSASRYKVFACTGTGAVTFGLIQNAYPEWWGIDGTEDEAEINAAITAVPAGSAVVLRGDYTQTSATIALNKDEISLKADGLNGAYINTAADVTGVTVTKENCLMENIYIKSTNATATSTGLLLDEGAKKGRYYNVTIVGHKYGLGLNSSSTAGVAYNEFFGCNVADNLTAAIILTSSGAGWVNENHWWGGFVTAAATAVCVDIQVTGSNQNVFNAVCFQGGDPLQFAVKDGGYNTFTNCRFEVDGMGGILINNGSSSWLTTTTLQGNHWSCRLPHIAIIAGRVHVNNENRFMGGITGGENGQTTVDSDSASGQKVLKVTDTTVFRVDDVILINSGGAREEWGQVASISAGDSLTLHSNLKYTHTQVQADDVEQRGLRYGLHYRTFDMLDFWTYGVLVAQIAENGNAKFLGTVSASTAPTP